MAVNRKINAQINNAKSPLFPTPKCLVGSAQDAVAKCLLESGGVYLYDQGTFAPVRCANLSVFSLKTARNVTVNLDFMLP